MVLDNPEGLTRFSDVVVIRSGVDFWPGVAAGGAVVAWRARREHVPPMRRLADLSPFGLLAYGAYEAACLVRDGCYGPASPVGLVPEGLTTRMLPLGLVVAVGATCLAIATYRWWALEPRITVLLAVVGVAFVRSVTSFWLPRLGGVLTRQHVTSLIMLSVTTLGLAAAILTERWRLRSLRKLVSEGEP